MARRSGRKKKRQAAALPAEETAVEPALDAASEEPVEAAEPEKASTAPAPDPVSPEDAPRASEPETPRPAVAPRADVPLTRWTAQLAQSGETAAREAAERTARSEAKLDGYLLELGSWLSSWQHTLELRLQASRSAQERQAWRRHHVAMLLGMTLLFALVFAGLVWVIRSEAFPAG